MLLARALSDRQIHLARFPSEGWERFKPKAHHDPSRTGRLFAQPPLRGGDRTCRADRGRPRASFRLCRGQALVPSLGILRLAELPTVIPRCARFQWRRSSECLHGRWEAIGDLSAVELHHMLLARLHVQQFNTETESHGHIRVAFGDVAAVDRLQSFEEEHEAHHHQEGQC